MSDHTPPASGSTEPVRAPDPIPSPWAAPPAGTGDHTYAPPVSDMTVSTADLSTPVPHQLGSGGETLVEFGAAERPAPRPGRRRAIVLSASTALLLLVGVGAYAGVRAWTGSAVEPESAMPASVSAFVRIDFNPGYGDKLTVNGLVKKFPTSGKSAADLLTKLETGIAKDAGLNYATDVKPWFGGRAGIGAWTDGQGKPVALIALASTDDAKAAATLTKLRSTKGADSFGFAMEKGYALIAGSDGDMQAAAAAAVAEAKTATLADSDTFKSTVAHVGGGNLLLGYADLGKVSTLVKSASASAPDQSGGGFEPGAGPLGVGPFGLFDLPRLGTAGGSAALTGFAAVGGKVTGDGIEVRAHVDGLKATVASSGTKVMSTLSALPSATIVGASTAGLDPNSDAAKQLSSTLGMLASGAAFGASGTDDPFAGGPTDPFAADPGTDPFGGDPGSDPLTGTLRSAIANVVTPVLTAKRLTVAFTGLGCRSHPGPAGECRGTRCHGRVVAGRFDKPTRHWRTGRPAEGHTQRHVGQRDGRCTGHGRRTRHIRPLQDDDGRHVGRVQRRLSRYAEDHRVDRPQHAVGHPRRPRAGQGDRIRHHVDRYGVGRPSPHRHQVARVRTQYGPAATSAAGPRSSAHVTICQHRPANTFGRKGERHAATGVFVGGGDDRART